MRRLFALIAPLLSLACHVHHASPPPAPWDEPAIERVTRTFDGRTHQEIGIDAAFARAANSEVVFLGETHVDETTHRVEALALERLAELRGGRVVLTLEMFERDVQPALDDYLAGRIDEAAFLARSRPWANYRTAYRPLIEFAKSHGIPVVAANTPADLRRKIGQGGAAAFSALTGTERPWVARELLPESDAYWKRVENAVRGHGMGGGPSSPEELLHSGQSLWDNTMAESIVDALAAAPGSLVLHVNGGFHSSRFDGTVHQVMLRRPNTRVFTLAIEPTSDLPAVDPRGGPLLADALVFGAARGRDLSDGTYAVTLGREHAYRLHLPGNASDSARAPLVVVLPESGVGGADTLALWKERLGDGAAVAVLDPSHPARADDLGEGGTFVRSDQFDDDLGLAMRVLDTTLAHLLRSQPVDPARVVVIGEHDAALPVLASATRVDRFAATYVGADPGAVGRLSELSLPWSEGDAVTPPPYPAAERAVVVFGGDATASEGVLADARASGVAARHVDAPAAAGPHDDALEDLLRTTLRLAPRARPASTGNATMDATPRARLWGRIAAARGAGTDVSAKSFSTPGRLPSSPGAFGGTTVVVLSAGASAAEQDAWRALVADDPLQKHSRFNRLRVATSDSDLRALLDQLATENRKNLLIVPAEFCATPDRMRQLQQVVDAAPGVRTVAYRPGLGSRLQP